MEFRIEKDTMGEIKVPKEKLWGAQTQRSLENFNIGMEKMPEEVIHALVLLKKSAALVHDELGALDKDITEPIVTACDEILAGDYGGEFPLSVWQTGSGTQTNMNVNEVIANRATKLSQDHTIHPNDHVNRGQSSNDTFPSAMHIAAVLAVSQQLEPALVSFEQTLKDLTDRYGSLVKIGRTHLQDAVPLTLGQEISGWRHMITQSREMISSSLTYLRDLAIGGTAVGTGLNAPEQFGERMAEKITAETGTAFRSSPNKFHALTSKDALVHSHGALKALAANLMKIANDIRLLASGPRGGIGELILPENEPGSSIMPGKVNPTQAEALTMVCVQVFGNDTTIGVSASQGHLELNVFMPVIIYNYLQSVRLLSDAVTSFDEHCASGIVPNEEKINDYVEQSLMLVTALSPVIGYEEAAMIAKKAHENGTTLKEEAIASGLLTAEQFDEIVDPKKMV